MSVDERRRRLQRRLEEVLGVEEAETLRHDISGRGVSRDELRHELKATGDELRHELKATGNELRHELKAAGNELRQELKQGLDAFESQMDAKLSVLGSELRAEMYKMKGDLLQQMNEQTKTLYRTIVVSNATMVFAVGGLAFAAARLA